MPQYFCSYRVQRKHFPHTSERRLKLRVAREKMAPELVNTLPEHSQITQWGGCLFYSAIPDTTQNCLFVK